jgi:pyruvate dehydrogenase E2 component (dihydrolipoyllysine-residue acetyltransferase)
MDVLMPQLGETVAEGKISKWFVSAGDAVRPGDNLFEIETDKVSMEVPAIAAGTLSEIRVAAGEVAPVGAVVAVIAGDGAAIAPQASSTTAAPAAKPMQLDPFREVRTPERNYGPARLAGGVTVTPLARRLAGEAGIDLTSLKGSGPRGRIVARDVAQSAKPQAAPLAQASAAIVLTAEVAIAQALALCAEANAAQKTKLELADVIVKAWAMSLRRLMPDQEPGIALTTGKLRSAVRQPAQSSLSAISTARHAPTANHTAVSTAISIPDVPGITSIVDILQPPYTTTLSIGAPRRAPVEAPDGSVRFVAMMTVTLTCDQRAVDATLGAELLAAFKGFVERPVTMLV